MTHKYKLSSFRNFFRKRWRWALNVAGILIARSLATVGMFFLTIDISRRLGAEALGQFTLWLSVAILIALVGRWGLDSCLLRIAASGNNAQFGCSLSQAWRKSLLDALALSTILCLLTGLMAFLVVPDLPPYLNWLLAAVPPLTLLGIGAGYARGRNFNILASAIDVGGIGAITYLLSVGLRTAGFSVDLSALATLFFLAAMLACAGVLLLLSFDVSREMKTRPADARIPVFKTFVIERYHFLLILVAPFLVQAGSFALVGPVLDDQTLGLLRAAERVSLLIVFPTIALNFILSSQVANYFANRNFNGIISSIYINGSSGIVIGIFIFLLIVFFGSKILSIMGDEFSAGLIFLYVLSFSQLLIVCSSTIISSLTYLGMSEKATRIIILSSISGLILFPYLCWMLGGIGFVYAYVIVSAIKLGLSLYYVPEILRLKTAFFSHFPTSE